MRFLETSGFSVSLKDDDGTITLSASKSGKNKDAEPKKQSAEASRAQVALAPRDAHVQDAVETFSVLITRPTIAIPL
jgi:hypothetical protein